MTRTLVTNLAAQPCPATDVVTPAKAGVTYEATPANQPAILERLEDGADVAPDELKTLATIAAKATSLVGAADEAAKERIETLEAQLAEAESRERVAGESRDDAEGKCYRWEKAYHAERAEYIELAKRAWRHGWICGLAGIVIGWASFGAIWYFCG